MKFSALLALIVVLLIACNKEDTLPYCGCDGKAFQELVNERVAYAGKGLFIHRTANGASSYGFRLCDTTLIDPIWQADTAKYVFRVSGQLKHTCIPFNANTLIAIPPVFTASQIVME